MWPDQNLHRSSFQRFTILGQKIEAAEARAEAAEAENKTVSWVHKGGYEGDADIRLCFHLYQYHLMTYLNCTTHDFYLFMTSPPLSLPLISLSPYIAGSS